MTGADFVAHIHARGGHLRLFETKLQYRPAGVLQPADLEWLKAHRHEVVAELLRSGGLELPPGRPAGAAGSDVPAWHCYVALRTPHERAVRADGSEYCGMCHPRTLR